MFKKPELRLILAGAHAPHRTTPIGTRLGRPWLAISVVRAGVSEEVLFRGYPIERLRELSGSRALASLLPLLLFPLAHVGPWGWAHMLVAGIGGAALTLLYLWRRNVWANILAHCIVDGVAAFA
jgi:membrane protease YdiL (CAAX protease family)